MDTLKPTRHILDFPKINEQTISKYEILSKAHDEGINRVILLNDLTELDQVIVQEDEYVNNSTFIDVDVELKNVESKIGPIDFAQKRTRRATNKKRQNMYLVKNELYQIVNKQMVKVHEELLLKTLLEINKEKSMFQESINNFKKMGAALISTSILTGVLALGVYCYNKIDDTAPDLSKVISMVKNVVQEGKYELEFGMEGPSIKVSTEKEKPAAPVVKDLIDDTLRDDFYNIYNVCQKDKSKISQLQSIVNLVDIKQAQYAIDGKTFVSEQSLRVAKDCLTKFEPGNNHSL